MKKMLIVTALLMVSVLGASQAMAFFQDFTMNPATGYPKVEANATTGITTTVEYGTLTKSGYTGPQIGYYIERKAPTTGYFSAYLKAAYQTVFISLKDSSSSIVASGAINRPGYFSGQISSVFNPGEGFYNFLVGGTVLINPVTKNLKIEWSLGDGDETVP